MVDGGRAAATPDMSVVGPQTYRRAHVSLSGTVHVFNVLFQPTGLNRLVGIDTTSLVNQDSAASDVLGQSVEVLGDAVRMASEFAQRVAVVEPWVGKMLESGAQDCAIGLASRMMIAAAGARVFVQQQSDQIIVLARALDLAWTTTVALLLLQAGAKGSSRQQLDLCFANFSRLQPKTAQTALQFYRMRERAVGGLG